MVSVVNWNPRKPIFRGRIRIGQRINNFGDLIGPELVKRILLTHGLVDAGSSSRRLLTVGSIMRLAQEGDTVWGTGINGKSTTGPWSFSSLDVRALRGPRTQQVLREMGIHAPAIFGDPGILVPRFWPEARVLETNFLQTYIPNLHDVRPRDSEQPNFVHPCSPLDHIIHRIAASSFVYGSSLHAVILAHAFQVPVRPIISSTEPLFKYLDYFEGVKTKAPEFATTAEEALRMGGVLLPRPDVDGLLDAFPFDLWGEAMKGSKQ